mmetsp:Transcript_11638/g.17064  ORF Transcript_11638/g.17064 Transcript_11638/m.17064 type:complete len:681 (+) Transcript_11638:438-2480(+)
MLLFLVLLPLVANSQSAECQAELARIFAARLSQVFPRDQTGYMASYSGFRLNDLGDFISCNNLEGASYATLAFTPLTLLTICGPSICTAQDYQMMVHSLSGGLGSSEALEESKKTFELTESIKSRFSNYKLTQTAGESQVEVIFNEDYIHSNFHTLDAGAITMLVFCVILFSVVCLGTAFDFYLRLAESKMSVNDLNQSMIPLKGKESIENPEPVPEPPKGALQEVLLCFSLYRNLSMLLVSRSAERTGERNTLDVMNAVRVMSICWVIVGHVVLLRGTDSIVYNYYEIGPYLSETKVALIYGGEYAVDTFFWLSGMLMAYLFLTQLVRVDSFRPNDWFLVYFHRFFRILPAYMFVLFFLWAFTKYIGYGPYWVLGDSLFSDCKDYWYTNFLFLNNFIPNGKGSGCLGWTWYLANDMQFFLVSPIILYFYCKSRKLIGWCCVGAMLVLNILSGVFVSRHFHLYVSGPDPEKNGFNYLYSKPYCRCGAYALGIACGMVLYARNHMKKTGTSFDKVGDFICKAIDRTYIRWFLYLLGAALVNIFIFIQHTAWKQSYEYGHDTWTDSQRYLWYGCSRIMFILGLSCLLLPMLLGHGKFVASMLSASVWTPLARLSFSTYLIHYGVLWTVTASQKTGYYLCDSNLFIDTLWGVPCSFAAAVPVYLMIESPFIGLEKVLFKKGKR